MVLDAYRLRLSWIENNLANNGTLRGSMHQVILNIGTGETHIIDAPVPSLRHGHVLIRTSRTLISPGTERMLVDFGRASVLAKVRQQPEKFKMVLDKVRADGIAAAAESVRSKLDQPLALGYCNVGTVFESAVDSLFRVGERVVSNGNHAEFVSVPKNLCARVPDNVDDESAVFTVLGAIGLQGIRLARPTIGETIVVTGLGAIGLLTVQMLRAQGCRVIGIDFDPKRRELARSFGALALDPSDSDDLVCRAVEFSRGRGVDGVVITASTSSSEPITQAAKMCRKRGRIILVGVTGLALARQDFYEKEITFQVSCSYGPGRYDEQYEQKGIDYPIGFVRWTEQRNFEAVLDLMSSGALSLKPLVTHRFAIERADEAYSLLIDANDSLGIVLEYPNLSMAKPPSPTIRFDPAVRTNGSSPAVIGCIGAGNYGGRILIPALAKTGAQLHTVVSANGVSSVHYAKKFGFAQASTSSADLFSKHEINAVIVTTRHDSHSELTVEALRTGRHVYVEKPLAITEQQLKEVEAAYSESATQAKPILMIGFNRRFSPHVQRIRELLEKTSGPKSINLLMNAGSIPANHWLHDPEVGGGRLIGEACHFVDLARFLSGSPILDANGCAMRDNAGHVDTLQISLKFENGSIASIQYYANGHRSFPKERIEVFASGRVLQLDNFRVLRGYGWSDFSTYRTWKQDKGHAACLQGFIDAVQSGGLSPIPAEEIFEVSRITIELANSILEDDKTKVCGVAFSERPDKCAK